MTGRRDELAGVRAAIRQRTDEMLTRTIAEAKAFTASPAYAEAIREIVAKGKALR